jgi:hypothetical protein
MLPNPSNTLKASKSIAQWKDAERWSEEENALSHAANSTKVQLKGKIPERRWLAREEEAALNLICTLLA